MKWKHLKDGDFDREKFIGNAVEVNMARSICEALSLALTSDYLTKCI